VVGVASWLACVPETIGRNCFVDGEFCEPISYLPTAEHSFQAAAVRPINFFKHDNFVGTEDLGVFRRDSFLMRSTGPECLICSLLRFMSFKRCEILALAGTLFTDVKPGTFMGFGMAGALAENYVQQIHEARCASWCESCCWALPSRCYTWAESDCSMSSALWP
jgi:hypothetical protein